MLETEPHHDQFSLQPRKARESYIRMDPDCAICSAPSAHECDCEAKGLEMAVRKAEHHVMQSVYSNIRLNMLEFFRLLTDRRKDAYTRHMEALTLSAYYHRNAPPHPNEIARARASLKRGIDEDWRSAVRRYPEVLEYYYSLVAVTLPSDDDPVVKDPPLDALKARRSWRSSEAVNNSDLSSEAGRSSSPVVRRLDTFPVEPGYMCTDIIRPVRPLNRRSAYPACKDVSITQVRFHCHWP
ncbi:hypothetical protein F5Y16DRAFT_409837 [Xylariaceae sp. FL0255]|nr:hypothetical protein F5Y16DRAFT_409837 [Xylariaceae sp. FL0255]